MTRRQPMAWLVVILYVLATVNGMQFYVTNTAPWLNTARYLAGTERLPFQTRVFPIPFLKLLAHVAGSIPFLNSGSGVFTATKFGPFFLSLVSFAIASIFVVLLYRAVSLTRSLSGVVAPIFLALTLATYVIRSANYFYPYDMPALAFFAAGLYFIYQRKFVLLLLVVLLGTFNRETTLFLIVIYVLDAAASPSQEESAPASARSNRMYWSQVSWLRAFFLAAVWTAIRLYLSHKFAGNDRSEDYLRFGENLHRLLSPRYWPTMLDLCGYLLPIVYLCRKRLASKRLATWLLVTPLWIILMLFVGVITETRIYGELIPLVAVAATLLLEEHIAQSAGSTRQATL
jgi:hypothetical protein